MIVNAAAGSADRDRVEVARERLASNGAVKVVETESVEHVDDVLRGLEHDRLVVCGGDGSIHVAVDRLRRADRLAEVTLGVVPLGTGNDLADTLGIPDDPGEAADAILASSPRRLDLIVTDDGVAAVNAAHAGIGADAAVRAADFKDQMGQAAYPLGAVAAGAAAEGWVLEVFVEGAPVVTGSQGPVLMAAVMNGRSFGGGALMAPHAEPDDGVLDVVVSFATRPAQRAAFGMALQMGRHLEREDVTLLRGSVVEIRGDPIVYNIDGDVEETSTSGRVFRVDPGAWSVLAPPT